MAEHKDIHVRVEQVDVPVTVWLDTPSESMCRQMHIPPGTKVFAVREPTTADSGYVHYLTPGRKSPGNRESDRVVTIRALKKRYRKTTMEIMKELDEGRTFELAYTVPLPFLDPRKGPLHRYVEIQKKLHK